MVLTPPPPSRGVNEQVSVTLNNQFRLYGVVSSEIKVSQKLFSSVQLLWHCKKYTF